MTCRTVQNLGVQESHSEVSEQRKKKSATRESETNIAILQTLVSTL